MPVVSPFRGRKPILPLSLGESNLVLTPVPPPEQVVEPEPVVGTPRSAPRRPEAPPAGLLTRKGPIPTPDAEAVRRSRLTTLTEMLTPPVQEPDATVSASKVAGRKIPLPAQVKPSIQPMEGYY